MNCAGRQSMMERGGTSGGMTVRFALGQNASALLPSINNKYSLSFGGWIKVFSKGENAFFYSGLNWPESGSWGWTALTPIPQANATYAWVGIGSDGSRIWDGTCGGIGEWHHYYCVFDGTSVKYYFDGILDKTLTFSHRRTQRNGNRFYINADDNTVNSSLELSVAALSIFDRALSASEVVAVRDAPLVDTSASPFNQNLLAGFNCNEGQGMEFANAVPGGPSLVISGSSCAWSEPLPSVMG